MIQDSYIVQIAKRKLTAINYVFMVTASISTLIFILGFNILPIILGYNIIYFTGIVSFFLVVGVVFLIRGMSFEYEIEVVNETVTICKIIAKKKRVFLTEFSIRDCIYIGPSTSDKFSTAVKNSAFVLNCTEDSKYDYTNPNNWFFHIKNDDGEYSVIFPLNEEMYPVFRRYNPRGTEFMNITKKEEEE